MNELFIGIAQRGVVRLFYPDTDFQNNVRLTRVGMQDSLQPENGELNIIEFEGSAIAIQGHNSDGWIYSASIIDTGDPIVTVLVHKVLGQKCQSAG